jgi:hypothetical protein
VAGAEQLADDFRVECRPAGGDACQGVGELGHVGDPVVEQVPHAGSSAAQQLRRIPDLDVLGEQQDSGLAARYASKYPAGLANGGFAGVDLGERFPVLNVMYGYTRGGGETATSRLVPFRHPRGGYRLYGDLSETEALSFRLDPIRVARWLTAREHLLPRCTSNDQDPRRARIAILESAQIPLAGDELATPTVGSDQLLLVHSYAHRLIRRTAVYAGIGRDALAEYLVPLHLGFFIYAGARGDFVLGGLQAVFETELDALITAAVEGEHRSPLDPGCSRGVGACLACLHPGEPSWRYFNSYLDSRVLSSAA